MLEDQQATQKEDAKLLKASTERLFDVLMEQSADRIYIKDRQSRFVTVSQTLARALWAAWRGKHAAQVQDGGRAVVV